MRRGKEKIRESRRQPEVVNEGERERERDKRTELEGQEGIPRERR